MNIVKERSRKAAILFAYTVWLFVSGLFLLQRSCHKVLVMLTNVDKALITNSFFSKEFISGGLQEFATGKVFLYTVWSGDY